GERPLPGRSPAVRQGFPNAAPGKGSSRTPARTRRSDRFNSVDPDLTDAPASIRNQQVDSDVSQGGGGVSGARRKWRWPMRKRALIPGLVSALVLTLAFTSVTTASAGARRVQLLDDCDPASFDAALQNPNACVKDGGTTFDEFIGQLVSMGQAPAWRFAPGMLGLSAGGSIDAYNRGGEFHTFTEVAAF